MLSVSNHAKEKWLIRGDSSKRVYTAWKEGVDVDAKNYSYNSARMDVSSDTIIFEKGGVITTAINVYSNTGYSFKHPVACYDCGQHHHSKDNCPVCGSDKWRLR